MYKALDLFSGAGGASMGLHRAGFDVTGVDIAPQRHYPFNFIQADALTFPLDGYDFIWASPPCQGYSAAMRHLSNGQPLLIPEIRARLEASGIPYVIENVPGAPLLTPVSLCGLMFGRALYRHRLFEASWPIMAPPHHFDHKVRASAAGHFEEETFISVAGHCSPISLAEAVMDIDWMSREELAESIPPYFSEYIGKQAIKYLEAAQCQATR